MVRKGKFNLLSLIIEDKLIYYKSLNKNTKFVAFAIIKVNDLPKILFFLNECLKKRFLNYYSIQINIRNNLRNKVILNFIDNEKEKITKISSLIFQEISELDNTIRFYKNNRLKSEYFKILSHDFNNDLNIVKENKCIGIRNHGNIRYYDIFQLNFEGFQINGSSLHNLLKLLKDLNRNGNLILNVKINNYDKLVLNSYYIDKHKNSENLNKDEINSLFNANFISPIDLDINSIYCILWRINISAMQNNIGNFIDLFLHFSYYNFHNLDKFNHQFENMLKSKSISYIRLNSNLLLIEDHFLFLIFKDLNIELIEKLIKKHLSKYFIYINATSKESYDRLLEISKIQNIDNLRILNKEDIIKFDFSAFKETLPLKNA
jgi:hypothetical protein